HVLNSDDGLVGEGPQQLDLRVRERSCGFATHSDRSNGMSIAKHRHRQDASKLVCTRQVLKFVLRVVADVGDVDDTSSQNGAMGAASPAWRCRVCITVGGGAFRRDLLKSNEVDELAVESEHGAQPGIAEAQRTRGDAIEYRLHVCWRAADHS